MLRARYKKSLSYTILFIGLGLIVVNVLWMALMKGGFANFMLLLVGVPLTVFGILMFTKPVFDLYSTSITVYNIFGQESHKAFLKDYSDLIFKGDRIFVDIDGKEKLVPINRKMVDEQDWNLLLRKTGQDITSEIHNL